MTSSEGNGRRGWADRVAFTPDGVAYRPGEIIYPTADEPRVLELVDATNRRLDAFRVEPLAPRVIREGNVLALFNRAAGVRDPRPLVRLLRDEGVDAQLNHVLFAHCGECCEPHPSAAGGVAGAPVYATPVYATPVYATPVYATPVYATPVYATPVYATGEEKVTGRRRCSVVPVGDAEAAPAMARLDGTVAADPRLKIVVLDTGLASSGFAPAALGTPDAESTDDDQPDSDGDAQVDPVAGHGTFIKGLIKQIAPAADVSVIRVLAPEGDGDEQTIAGVIDDLGTPPQLGGILSLSFGAPVLDQKMTVLARAVTSAQARGWVVVASAGNDASCRPSYPAAFPDVVSVGAIGPHGPAPFTNYGPWVRACAPGVDLISTYFDHYAGDTRMGTLRGWGKWSGTSFAAPVVVGALAQQVLYRGLQVADAVRRVVDDPDNLRLHNLGTVVEFR